MFDSANLNSRTRVQTRLTRLTVCAPGEEPRAILTCPIGDARGPQAPKRNSQFGMFNRQVAFRDDHARTISEDFSAAQRADDERGKIRGTFLNTTSASERKVSSYGARYELRLRSERVPAR